MLVLKKDNARRMNGNLKNGINMLVSISITQIYLHCFKYGKTSARK